MGIHFLRGNSQTPKGHAILLARSARDARIIYSTYCLVPPIPMSLAKYLPPLFAAHIPSEELQGVSNISGMPIPPMLEEGMTSAQLELLAERRDDDLCDIGTISGEEMERMQMAAIICQEYAQMYAAYIAQISRPALPSNTGYQDITPLENLDADDLFFEALSERNKLSELTKCVGSARYALDGNDQKLLQDIRKRMERIARFLPDKYRGAELTQYATSRQEHSSELTDLYLKRAYKLLDEEYGAIRTLDEAIRELQK